MGVASQGSVRELSHGAQGLDVLEDEGGAAQGLPVTGVLEWTAVKNTQTGGGLSVVQSTAAVLNLQRDDSSNIVSAFGVSVMSHPPTESQGSEVMSQVG